MKVLLIDIDSKIPNLALMKISAYYKGLGHEVGFNINNPDKVFISCIFEKNKHQVEGVKYFYPNAEIEIGGSGVNNKVLSDDIEFIKPDYDLYNSTYSQGFTTRGCIKRCTYCIVPDKEGKLKRHQHIKDFHDDQFNSVMVMDNNILADKDWFFKNTDFILDNNLKINIEQGIDKYLLDKEFAQRLSELKFSKTLSLAYDSMKDEKAVLNAITLLKDAGINLKQKVSFFVLVGFNTTHQEDLYRVKLLKKMGVNSFVMQFKRDKFTRKLARWSNRRHAYWGCEPEQFSPIIAKEEGDKYGCS